MATKPKSRTSNSSLSKKAHVPVWAIVLGVLVLVGLGAFFVFKSFASGTAESSMMLYCAYGRCYQESLRLQDGTLVQGEYYQISSNPGCTGNSYHGSRNTLTYKSHKGVWYCVGPNPTPNR